jgi:hypothetical protein
MSDETTPKLPRFSVKLRYEPVEIEARDGQVHLIHVTELTGMERDAYLDWVAAHAPKYDALGKLTEPRQFEQHQANLIQRCLRTPEGKKGPFPVAEIQQWAASVQEGLFEMCQRICSFDKEAMERAKKDSPGNENSSST